MSLEDSPIAIRVGLVFLIAAWLWPRFAHPSAFLSADMIDGVAGLLYGVSIGCMLLAIMKRRRSGW